MTFNNKIATVILLFIVILGGVFRFAKLGSTPAGVYLDEAALGYNAYSILKTGKDEFGFPYPTMFRSFTTFQSPIYTYLTVPVVALLGLNPFSVRFVSAFFGLITIPLLFLLINKLSFSNYGYRLSSLSAFLLAISPWHILYSRTAYEANVALFFLLLGLYLFHSSLHKHWLFLPTALSFTISAIAYRAEIIIAPILILTLAIQYHKTLVQQKQKLIPPFIFSVLVSFLVFLPTLKIVKTPGFASRSTALNIFSLPHEAIWGYAKSIPETMSLLNFHPILVLKEFTSLYSSYFSPRYLFSLGDAGPRSSYPDFGTFFPWLLPFYLIGIYQVLKKDEISSQLKTPLLCLLLISPIPAALTRDPYTTIRSLTMVIPLVILVAIGILKTVGFLSSSKKNAIIIGLLFLVTLSTLKLYISIFRFNDYFRAQYWDYGWEEVVQIIREDLDPNLPIVVDNSRGMPYINLLFFLSYSPEEYQKNNFEVPLNEYYTNMSMNPVKKIGNITVKGFQWGADTDDAEQYLIVDGLAISDAQIMDHNLDVINQINYPGGGVALRVLKTNPKN